MTDPESQGCAQQLAPVLGDALRLSPRARSTRRIERLRDYADAVHPPLPRRIPAVPIDETRRPPEYTTQDMTGQIEAWMRAADAFNEDRWGEDSAEILVPSGNTDSATYASLVTQTAVGAAMCGYEMNRRSGRQFGERPEGAEWVVEALDPRREGPALERVAAIAVAAAANGEADRTIEQIAAYATPDDRGVERIADLMSHLLRVYVCLTAAPTGEAGDAR